MVSTLAGQYAGATIMNEGATDVYNVSGNMTLAGPTGPTGSTGPTGTDQHQYFGSQRGQPGLGYWTYRPTGSGGGGAAGATHSIIVDLARFHDVHQFDV